MGMTCIEYINDYRLNIAANLLLTTRMRITEVAASIGITNLSYFNRIFKKKYHITPKEYRVNADNTLSPEGRSRRLILESQAGFSGSGEVFFSENGS